jgi:hypothetical protein
MDMLSRKQHERRQALDRFVAELSEDLERRFAKMTPEKQAEVHKKTLDIGGKIRAERKKKSG